MTEFVDLHLRPTFTNSEQMKKIINRASELGYRMVGIPIPPNLLGKTVHILQRFCSDANIDLVTRLDLTPNMPYELLLDLRRFRRKFEVISVTCSTKSVARQAAKDRRVDLLSFSTIDIRERFFDRAEAGLASKASASLEVDIASLFPLKGSSRIRILSRLRREMAIAERFGVPIVLSSGAANLNFMRSPSGYAALATLFDVSQESALRALSENPLAIIKRNREKLSQDYIAPGIRIVKRPRR